MSVNFEHFLPHLNFPLDGVEHQENVYEEGEKNKVLKPHFDAACVHFQTRVQVNLNVVSDVAVLLDMQLGAQTSTSKSGVGFPKAS